MTQRNVTYSYREHRRQAKTHFINRWKERIRTEPPNVDVLAQEFRDEMSGRGHGMLKLLRTVGHHGSRWLAKVGVDREIVITYDHRLHLPITVWAKQPNATHTVEPT